MVHSLIHKKILLGVTGGIAAYKSADLVRKFRENGSIVQVVMTENAEKFITPLTLQALSENPVRVQLMDTNAEAAMGHIELARWADVILIAPATADFLAKLASGQAGNLLTTLCLATRVPVAIAPAMNQQMWANPATQRNVEVLKERGYSLFGPDEGSQACGEIGVGRMKEPLDLVYQVAALFDAGDLKGNRVLITAGPTRESVDPVRFLSNRSSGKMGYALAAAAVEAGAEVILVSGPTALSSPMGVTFIPVTTAEEMYRAVMSHIDSCQVFIGNAAVADYTPVQVASEKIKKQEDSLLIQLRRTKDILAEVAALPARPYTVGFCAETENLLEYAQQKYREKRVDMMVANRVGPNEGFDQEENEVIVLTSSPDATTLPRNSKVQLARQLMQLIGKANKERCHVQF